MPRFFKIVVLFFLLSILVIVLVNFVKVREIELKNTSCVAEDQLSVKGKLIFTIDERKLEKDLKEKFSCVAGINLQKTYPSKIKIEIKGEGPVAKIAASDLAITASGQVVSNQEQNLPTLYLASTTSISPGQKITDEISLFAAKLAGLLAKSDFHAINIRIVDTDIAVYDASDAIALFSSKEPPERQVDSLQLVLSTAKMGEQKITKIDLRFEKPVITFK